MSGSGGGVGGSILVVMADFMMSFVYAWVNVFIKKFVYNILGFHHDAFGEAVYVALKIANTMSFQLLSKYVRGGTYNPLTVLYHSITGDFNHIFFALNARIPAQVLGSIYAVKLIKEHVRGAGDGPRINADTILEAAFAEGALTLVYVTISLLAQSKVHSGFFYKAWITSVCKVALIILGTDITGTSINPASMVGWAYHRGEALSKEHLLVYWIFPFEATLLAVWISSFLTKTCLYSCLISYGRHSFALYLSLSLSLFSHYSQIEFNIITTRPKVLLPFFPATMSAGSVGGNVLVVIADFMMAFIYAWVNVFIKKFVYNTLGFHHDAFGEVVYVALKIANTMSFQLLSKYVRGGTYNPLTVLYHSITGDFNHIFFALNARIPAQVLGSIYAVKLIKEHVRGAGNGPRVNAETILEAAYVEGALTLVYVTISLLAQSKVHSGFFLKAWITSVCKVALIILGTDITGTSINPASVVGWAYHRGEALSSEHLLVYWIFPFEATLLAVWICSFITKPHHHEEKEKVKEE